MHPFSSEPPPPANFSGAEPTVNLLRFAWNVVMARLGTFVSLTLALILGGLFVLGTFFVAAMVVGFNMFQPKLATPSSLLMVQVFNVFVSALVIAPLTAGFYGVVFSILRNERDFMKGFSAAGRCFIPVAMVHLIMGAFTTGVGVVVRLLVDPLVGSLVNFAVASLAGFAVILVVPAIVGLGMGVGDAFGYNFKRVMARPFSYLGYYIAAQFLAGLGFIACGIGIVLTFGVGFVALALLITGIVPLQMEGSPGVYPRHPEQAGY